MTLEWLKWQAIVKRGPAHPMGPDGDRECVSTINDSSLFADLSDEQDAQFTGFYAAAALREAAMLVARNEPQHHECYAVPLPLMAHFDSGSILAEALAAFVVADLA